MRSWLGYLSPQAPASSVSCGDTDKLTNVCSRYFGTNRIVNNWHWCLGVMWRKGNNHFDKNNLKTILWTVEFYFIDPQNYFHIMRTFLSYVKDETLNEINTPLDNLWQRKIHLSDFFPILIGAHYIYTRWSSRCYGLGCHAPVVTRACKKSSRRIPARIRPTRSGALPSCDSCTPVE